MVATEEGVADWLRLVRGEYLEMPGLSLTKPQVQRLWGLDKPTSEALLRELVHRGFLRLTEKGTYVRAKAA
ncbi:MAG: hypothetical protein HY701_04555 [Gemmatimonadetes bacterium]|nr:hypothetical protein [Gemmatimonadota bacterium]